MITDGERSIVCGDNQRVTIKLSNVLSGIVKAWLTIKTNAIDTDIAALLQKEVTVIPSSSGAIVNTGTKSVISFEIDKAESKIIPVATYVYDIQVRNSLTAIYTPERGTFTFEQGVTVEDTL